LAGKKSHPRRSVTRVILGPLLFPALLVATSIGVVGLAVLLIQTFTVGLPWLDLDFLSNFPSRNPAVAGIRSALFGTLWVAGFTALFSFPLAIGAAIYLEEYAPKNRVTRFIDINISNLAGVPSIVYGLLGLAVFVQLLTLGRSILAGALTLTLLIMPIIIIAAREAIAAVPRHYRLAAYALGATQWQMVRRAVLPSAIPGILTGTILAMSRAIGEAAPMLAISALVFITFIPTSPLDRFTVLPIQIFNWVSRPQEEFAGLAAAGIIVLLLVLVGMNSIAILIRNKYQRRVAE
jgi:phosphate transport system permease protein